MADTTDVINSGTYDVDNSDTIQSLSGSGGVQLANGIILTSGDAGNDTVSGVVSGAGALTKTGSGTLTFSANNTYTGDTTISAGTLKLTGTLAATTDVINSGTYDVDATDTIQSLSGSGGVELANSITLTSGDSGDDTVSGVISGAGALTKVGSGTLTLSGSNTYSGSTTLAAGIISISSRGIEKAKIAAEKYDIKKFFGSYQEQINDPEVDAIINSLPNSMHCDWTIKCAEAGKHILCEKPLATTTDECRKMIDAANANNVILVEAFTHRWNHHLKTAKKIIKNGDLGSVVTTDSSLCFTTNPENNIRFNPSLSGGALWDAGCYAVYATRFVLSEEPIYANGESFDINNYGVDTTFKGIMEFESGVLSSITTSMNQPFRCHMNIDLTNGRIEICLLYTSDAADE